MSWEADHRRLSELIAEVLRCNRPMTEQRIATAVYRLARVRTDARSVRLVLAAQPNRFRQAKDRFRFLRRSPRWQLVEAGPAEDPGTSGALVPARPRPPYLSGSAAAPLTFREEDPPPQAIGRLI
jgi:hypothetical protein